MGDALCDDQVQNEIQESRYKFLALSCFQFLPISSLVLLANASQPPDEIEIKHPCMDYGGVICNVLLTQMVIKCLQLLTVKMTSSDCE